MPAGLHIEFPDSGPDMNITAGMRGLMYIGSFSNGGAASKSFPNLIPGYKTYFMPESAFRYIGSWVNGQIMYLTGYSVTGNEVKQNYGGNNQSGGSFAGSVWQIDGSSPNSGLLISDSTDFTAIGNELSLGLCIYRGTVTINGSWTPPIPSGATGVTIFVKFNQPSATLFYNGSSITSWGNAGGDTTRPSVTAKIAIFASGIEPTPQKGGLNMWNSSGRCTFSSANRPFITYGKTIKLNRTNQNTDGGMVQLCCTGAGNFCQDNANIQWTKAFGVSMGSNYATVGWGSEINKDANYYGADEVTYWIPGIEVLTIPDMYI